MLSILICRNESQLCMCLGVDAVSLQLLFNFLFSVLLQKSSCFQFLLFKTLDFSQGSVATHLRCDGIFSDSIITNFLLILTVKYFLKSINIW